MSHIEVRDPGNRLPTVLVPFNKTLETLGRAQFLESGLRVPAVCILFQKGMCKSQKRCRQIHVCRDTIDFLRDQAAGPCCANHGGTCVGLNDVTLRVQGRSLKFSPGCFEATRGLLELQRAGKDVVADSTRICGLNQLRRCRWGANCMNIHLCREIDISGGCLSEQTVCATHSCSNSTTSSSSLSPSSSSVHSEEDEFLALDRFAASFTARI
eukprot:TRINITY_DN1336_c5_g1_i1.p1 TRINITY_DN1336_c5_g1~~TRINITY_DN1336_c5_g1_i1.p1  ORF type:complete len:212 (+),score=6.38 TRINITY_DN1336_c5_g1_i1:70-705(+)